jgi:hypothetical protein
MAYCRINFRRLAIKSASKRDPNRRAGRRCLRFKEQPHQVCESFGDSLTGLSLLDRLNRFAPVLARLSPPLRIEIRAKHQHQVYKSISC